MTKGLFNPIAATLIRAGPMIWACERPPTEKAPLESVLNYRKIWLSHAAGNKDAHGSAWSCSGIINASAAIEKVGLVCGKFSTFAESFRNLAENSGLPTVQTLPPWTWIRRQRAAWRPAGVDRAWAERFYLPRKHRQINKHKIHSNLNAWNL